MVDLVHEATVRVMSHHLACQLEGLLHQWPRFSNLFLLQGNTMSHQL